MRREQDLGAGGVHWGVVPVVGSALGTELLAPSYYRDLHVTVVGHISAEEARRAQAVCSSLALS